MKVTKTQVLLLLTSLFLFAGNALAIPYRTPAPATGQAGPRRAYAPVEARGVSFLQREASTRALRNALVQRTRLVRASWAPRHGVASRGRLAQQVSSSLIQWTLLGPSKIGGRVNAILTNSANPEQLFIATSSGGIWESLDGGAHWVSVGNFLGSLSVVTLARLPDGTLLAGTGDQDNRPQLGVGILASHDGGITWQPLAAADPAVDWNWHWVDDIAVNPDGVILVAVGLSPLSLGGGGLFGVHGGSIYRSTDGGASFTAVVQTPNTACRVLSFDPGNPKHAIAEFDNGTVRTSDDAGSTWSAPITIVANGGRSALSWAPTQPGWVYAVVQDANVGSVAPLDREFKDSPYASWQNRADFDPAWLKDMDPRPGAVWGDGDSVSPRAQVASGSLYLSKDGGKTWQRQGAPSSGLLCSDVSGFYCQGTYDNVVWVSPTDAQRIVAGGIDLFESADGGLTWTKITDWRFVPQSAHADHHALASDPRYNGTTNKVFYDGDDGGMYSATDITAVTTVTGWTQRNVGLADTEFYSGAGHAGDVASSQGIVPILGGTQDNGTPLHDANVVNTESWVDISGGDGVFTDVDPSDANFIYGEYPALQLFQSREGGADIAILDPLPPDSSDGKALFLAPFLLDPSDPNAMFAGGESLWYGKGLKTGPLTWTSINGTTLPDNDFVVDIAVNPADDNDVWVGLYFTGLYHSTNALSASPSWQPIGAGTLPDFSADRFAFGSVYVVPEDRNVIYASYPAYAGNALWKSTDAGASWSKISAGLPQVPVRAVTTEPGNKQMVFAATDAGLYISIDGGASWSTNAWGPANVSISQLHWFDPVKHELLVASYGRGMYLGTVNGAPVNPKPTIVALAPSSASVGGAGFTLKVSGTDFIADSVVEWNGSALATTFRSGTELAAPVPASDLAVAGKAQVTVVTPAPGGGTSNPASFVVSGKPPVANDGTLTTTENKAASGKLVATDPDGDPLTFAIFVPPGHGSVKLDNAATGDYTYTPAQGYTGSDSFKFNANDGQFTSNNATVSITVSASQPPVAKDGTLTTTENKAASGTLVATDPEGDPLAFAVVAQPGHGSVKLDDAATGAYTYTPADGYSGSDSFTFKANDGLQDSNVATVSITVNANQPPVASDGTLSANENTAASGKLVATDPEDDPLTFIIVTQPAQGSVTLNDAATGAYTYTPATDFSGSDSFTFKANDGLQDSNVATVSVTVNATPPPSGGGGGGFGWLGLAALFGLAGFALRRRRG